MNGLDLNGGIQFTDLEGRCHVWIKKGGYNALIMHSSKMRDIMHRSRGVVYHLQFNKRDIMLGS